MLSSQLLIGTLYAAQICCAFDRRQLGSDGALTPRTFVRRGFHASAVANGWVYIDGGEVSYRDSNGSMQYRYSTTLEAIDLSQDWTNSTVTVHSIPKSSDVPDLIKAGLWYDDARDLLYSGFAGRASYINNSTGGGLPPYPPGVWQYRPDGANIAGTNTTIASTDALWENIIRPCSGLISYGAGKGYVLGGASAPNITGDQVPAIGGMLVFDFESKTLLNVSTMGSQFGSGIHMGAMVYVPNVGLEGVFIVVGGEDANLNMLPLDSVSIYDPSKQKWYTQTVTGDIPKERKAHCIAGIESEEGSFDILMYGGWSGVNTAANRAFDEIFVLSLPAFEWINVPYTPNSARHTVSCLPVGGNQIMTIGGLASDSTADSTAYIAVFDDQDPWTQGLAVFNMETLWWSDHYSSNSGPYNQSMQIKAIYAKGNHTIFNDSDVAVLFANSTAYGNDFSNSTHESHVGAIVGGVVGGIAAIVIIAAIAFFLWRRKRSSARAKMSAESALHSAHEQHPLYEIRDKNSREFQAEPVHRHEAAPRYEMHEHSRAFEME